MAEGPAVGVAVAPTNDLALFLTWLLWVEGRERLCWPFIPGGEGSTTPITPAG